MKAVVCTTICEPTPAIHEFVRQGHRDLFDLFVVLDKNTPAECVDAYQQLAEKESNVKLWDVRRIEDVYEDTLQMKYVPWNSIKMRNIGMHAAYANAEYEQIGTIDDDNVPYPEWAARMFSFLGTPVRKTFGDVYHGDWIADPYLVWASQKNGFRLSQNTRDFLTIQNARIQLAPWFRGIPRDHIHRFEPFSVDSDTTKTFSCLNGIVDGDPDVSAMFRYLCDPREYIFTDDWQQPIALRGIHPFNSQNTTFSRSRIPYYIVFPHAQRMDDIWAAYWYSLLFPEETGFISSTVYQDRRAQSLAQNTRDELLEMQTDSYLETVKKITAEWRRTSQWNEIRENPSVYFTFLQEEKTRLQNCMPPRSVDAWFEMVSLFTE